MDTGSPVINCATACPVIGPLDVLTVKYLAAAGAQGLHVAAASASAETKVAHRVRAPNTAAENNIMVRTTATRGQASIEDSSQQSEKREARGWRQTAPGI